MEEEIWKDIPDEPGYDASTEGRIRNKKTGNILSPFYDPMQDYGRVTLIKTGIRRKLLVHFLVAKTFLGPKPNGYEIDHINGNRHDCRLGNLRYVTPKENRKNPVSQFNSAVARYRKLICAGKRSLAEIGNLAEVIKRACED